MKKVQFGCGGNHLEGWTNHDRDVDLSKLPLPYDDNSVDMIFIEHCLEHFGSHQALAILDEFYRILKTGGVLRVCCPVLERLDTEAKRDIILNHGHEIFFSEVSLKTFIRAARFKEPLATPRKPCDSHWKVIGKEKDDKETARVEAIK